MIHKYEIKFYNEDQFGNESDEFTYKFNLDRILNETELIDKTNQVLDVLEDFDNKYEFRTDVYIVD